MKFKVTWVIYFLFLFVPFESIALKYLPVSDKIYGYLLFLVEILIYLIAGLVLSRFLLAGKLPKGTPIDKPLMIFIAYSLVITFTNHAPWLQAFIGLRVLLRYVPLFYVLSFIHTAPTFPKKIFNSLMIVAIIQGLISTWQHFSGIAKFWYPRASELEIGGKQASFKLLNTSFSGGREMGAGIGTFGDSVFLALFLVMAFTVMMGAIMQKKELSKNLKLLIWSTLLLLTASLFYTYSRGSVLVAFAGIPIVLYFSGGAKKLAMYVFIGLIALSPVILFGVLGNNSSGPGYINPKIKYTDPISNIITVFTSSYVENTMQFSRGAILTEIGGELLKSFKVLGYSPAQEFALDKASTQLFGSNMPINNLPIINDVYWVAFIIYYGFAGLAIFWFILYQLLKGSLFVYRNTPDLYLRIFALSFSVMVLLAIPYSFILRTFVFRAFGFYFWLIAGLVFSEWRRLKALEKEGMLSACENPVSS